jgi:hypothetical protein
MALLALCIAMGIALVSWQLSPPAQQPEYAHTAKGRSNQQAKENPFRAFWRWITHDAITFFTVALFIATVVLAIVAIVQIRFLARADEMARIAANALPALERGYVFAKPRLVWAEYLKPKEGMHYQPSANCTFTNHGRTPVVLWRYEADYCLLSASAREPDNIADPMPIYLFPGGHILEAGDSWKELKDREVPGFDQATMDAISTGKIFIWFYGRMTYEDIFGNERVTRTRWRYNGLAKSFMPYSGKPYNERT